MDIDYKAIGKRIRLLRKEMRLTQDMLRDRANISKTHMSHIETGTTKLSLPTLIDIAVALDTSVDYLLGTNISSSAPVFRREIENILKDCSAGELYMMAETMRFIKGLSRAKECSDNRN